MWRAFVVLALLSVLALAQENIMVCKDIKNVFTNAENGGAGGHIPLLQGPPGKRGVQGSRGPPGLPGVQGFPGIPGVVNYEKISEMIDEKLRKRSYCSVGAGHGGKIPDSSFTASSVWSSAYVTRYGRINTPAIGGSNGAWAARPAQIGQWIQVNLGRKVAVVGVMIQGASGADEWVTSFHVSCGLTTSSMRKISDGNGTIKLFAGNTDRNTVVTHFIRYEECRYLRIYPQTWHGHMCLRMDFIESC